MASQLTIQALAARLSRAQNKLTKPPSNGQQRPPEEPATSRRLATAAAAASATLLLVSRLPPATTTAPPSAGAFELRITVPEQSSEEAEAMVKTHARSLVRVREFIDARSWRELQSALRASASNLKLDLYTIIQASPASLRPELRRLYSDLFDSVTSLDYAARDKDELQVQEYYTNIVSTLEEIFAKIM